MLETTLVALQDIMLDKVLDEAGRKILCSEFSKIMQQVTKVLIFIRLMHHSSLQFFILLNLNYFNFPISGLCLSASRDMCIKHEQASFL